MSPAGRPIEQVLGEYSLSYWAVLMAQINEEHGKS